MSGVPQTIPVGSAIANAENVKGISTHTFWLAAKVQLFVGDIRPEHAPIFGLPTQKDSISPTVTTGVIFTSALIHTVSWTFDVHLVSRAEFSYLLEFDTGVTLLAGFDKY